ncbi:metallophosphoesterase family protein [Paenibacillus foliorum]|uniref:metallophosphoesterase family protein n=1 Tax=Paenibacillus foliorum TaxID=2654974 RepID=UPI001C104BFC|nr:metallophosphoesterase [Paenibacillus foliorum]
MKVISVISSLARCLMKIAVFTDLHSISPQERLTGQREKRSFFADSWPSFRNLNGLLQQEAPDLAICLGDMVDWYSDENRDFALELLNQLPCPWLAVPGNHDYESYAYETDRVRSISAVEGYEAAVKGWKERGIELHNRYLDLGHTGLVLLDSARSGVPEGTKEWLGELKNRHSRQLLFTHVPLDVPETREYILSVDSKRNLNKYVQSHSPWLFQDGLQEEMNHIFTGHLHFPGDLQVSDTVRMHMLGMAITDLRRPERPASACIIELEHDAIEIRRISL